MNEKAKTLFKNLNYTVTANFLVLGISIILNLFVPKFIGLTEYSYWQLYIFYSSYVGFFHFGWIDGIYLKIGGEEYNNLDKRSLGTQFYYLFIFESTLALILSIYAFIFVSDFNRQIIWFATASILIITNLKTFILYILQSTNRIKEYASLSRDDRYLYLVLSMSYLFIGGRDFKILIFLDVISKLVITIWGLMIIKDISLGKKIEFRRTIVEIRDNIRIGSNLMLGNLASMLILGISRFFVEQRWDIETFGKLSFALSISNMFMIFINAVSVVLYPVLRRTEQSNLPSLYIKVRTLFVPFSLALLLFFIPIRVILEWWLPEYQSSLFFMGMLFPMIVYEGRISLLVNTYLKTIREERIILYSNGLALIMSIITTILSVYIFNDINLAVLSITLCLGFRCFIAELMLSKKLQISVLRDNLIEGMIVIVFIVSNILFNSLISFSLYFLVFGLYFILNSKIMKKNLKSLLLLVKT